MATRRRKRRRRAVSRDQMTPEEIKRAKRRAARRKRERAKRRFYAALFFALLIFAVIFFLVLKKGKSDDSVSGNAVSEEGYEGPSYGAGGTIVNDAPEEEFPGEAGEYGVSENDIYHVGDLTGVIDTSVPMDVTSGKVAFVMDTVSGNRITQTRNVKLAMAQAAYFTGTSTPLQNYLSAYGEGSWHAITKTVNEMTVFYSGVHKVAITPAETEKKAKKKKDEEEPVIRYKDVPFQVNFVVYEDGSFVVLSVEEGGQNVNDFEGWLKKRVIGEDAKTDLPPEP